MKSFGRRNVKFGIHSLLFNETFLEKDLPLLAKCKEMGFDAIEIIPFAPDEFPASKVRERAAELGLIVNMGYGLPEDKNPISSDPAIREAGVEFACYLTDLAVEAGAVILTGILHCGWGSLTGKARTEEEWRWGVENYRRITEHALQGNPDLVLGIEPVNRFESHFINTAADAVKFVEDVGMPNAKVHLDTFHMIREEDDIAAATRATGPHLGYVHACENQRGVPGRGMVPWRDFFAALRDVGYDGCVTIESFDPGMENIAKLCCIWRKLADSPEQLATEGLAYLRELDAELATLR